MPRPLYPRGKSPRCSLYRRLGGSQSRSGRCGEEKHLFTLPGVEPLLSGPYADWAGPVFIIIKHSEYIQKFPAHRYLLFTLLFVLFVSLLLFRMPVHLIVFLIPMLGCLFLAPAFAVLLDHSTTVSPLPFVSFCEWFLIWWLPNDPSLSFFWIHPILPEVLHFFPQPLLALVFIPVSLQLSLSQITASLLRPMSKRIASV
jgi:hypothetical protein